MSHTTVAELVVSNGCPASTIEIFWIDYGCEEVSYGQVAPGRRFSVSSFATHPWRIRDAITHVLLREIPPLTAPTTVTYP